MARRAMSKHGQVRRSRQPNPQRSDKSDRRGPDNTGRRPSVIVRFGAYCTRHLQMMLYSLGKISSTPFSSFMTISVIGIALALPAGLYVVLDNLQGISSQWQTTAQISLFLKKELDRGETERLIDDLRSKPEISDVTYISPDEALAEFRRISGFGDALNTLDHNPLPPVLVVHPAIGQGNAAAISRLVDELRALPAVDIAELDMDWIKRFFAIMAIGKRVVFVLGALLSLAVLLIIGNTIRLGLQNRRDEIEIMKLIGATDAFIRRPFLYSGIWYGLFGGIVGWLIVHGSIWVVREPVSQLAILYESQYVLSGMNMASSLALLAVSSLLGLFGSRFTVGRHLKEVEPA